MLKINHLYKKHGNVIVLKDISMNIKPGEIVGLIGENGAGKTTLMKTILGLYDFDQGEIIFNGKQAFQKDAEMMKEIGYLMDTELFDYLTAYQHLELLGLYERETYNKKQIIEILDRLSLKNKKLVKSYSYGMKQRLRLAMAMILPRKLFILDEPLLGLDIKTIQEFKTYLKEIANTGVSILLSSHQLSEIEDLIDRYLILDEGEIKQEILGGQIVYKVNLGIDAEQIQIFLSNFASDHLKAIQTNGEEIYIFSQEALNEVLKFAYSQSFDVKISQVNVVNQMFLSKGV